MRFLVDWLLHGGTRRFRQYESWCLERFAENLSSEVAQISLEQAVKVSARLPLLARIADVFQVSEIRPPASEEEIERFLRRLDATVPGDLLALLHETDGFHSRGWDFYGTKSRRIVLPDLNCHLLAERDPLALVVIQGQSQPVTHLLDQIVHQLGEPVDSFLDALLDGIAREEDV